MAEPIQSGSARVLIERARVELSAEIDFGRAFHIASAPGMLDVMGGIAQLSGSDVCKLPIDRRAAVLVQERNDREIQIFSFNLFDEHRPFTFRMSLDRMARSSIESLRAGFAEPGRKWAGYVAGCIAILHREKLVDLNDPATRGINLAIYSDVPMQMGLGSSAALTAASMKCLAEHFQIGNRIDSSRLASLCDAVELELIDAKPGVRTLTKMPVELKLPAGFQIIAISSGVRDQNADVRIQRHLHAAAIAHAMILEKMREMGRAAGRELIGDPTGGLLANLDPEDYKKFFRPYLPVTKSEDGIEYHVQGAADHHVLEARRVRQFREFVQQAAAMEPGDTHRYILMDKAGHLMYASHLSYMNDAQLGSAECDLLVNRVRAREKSSLYGARITACGCGGTVAVLGEQNEPAEAAISQITQECMDRASGHPEVIRCTATDR